MAWEHERAHSACVHTCHTPRCLNLNVQPNPLHTKTTYHRLLGEDWERAEFQTSAAPSTKAHYVSQAPRSPELPLRNEALVITGSY
jgi:hypothetical protein